MTTISLPDLAHRAPDNRWLVELPDTLDVAWIDARYDELRIQWQAAGTDAAAWIEVVRNQNEVESHVSTVYSRASLRFRQDASDEAVVAEYKRVTGELAPAITRRSFEFAQALVGSSALPAIEREFGEQFVRGLRSLVELHDDDNVAIDSRILEVLMQQTSIFAGIEIEWRGQKHPWSYARKAAHDTDHDARHGAFHSQLAAVREHEDTLQQIFDDAGELRLQTARNLGLDGYPQLRYRRMGRHDYGPAEVASFRDGIERHLVPLSRDLRKQQARAQGSELLHPADTEIWAEPPAQLAVGVDEQLAAATRMFERVGDDFSQPFRMLVEEQLVDLAARPGKGAGAFCTSFPDQRVPYIFCNSVDSPDDVKTLVHEFGHALQSWRSSQHIELVPLRFPSLESCEIHSMSLELLTLPYVDAFFASDDVERYRREHLRSTLLSVPYMAAIDEFQHGVYASLDGLPDAQARGELWEQAARRFLAGIDLDAEPWWTRNRWLMQLHVFHYPFYYIDYALARTVSWELWLDSLEDERAALERYLVLCDAGGTQTFRELLASADLADPFDPATLKRTAARLRPHLELG